MITPSALAGIRVLEFTEGLAARVAGALLADLGAEVIAFPADGGAVDASDPARVWSERRKVVRGIGVTDQARLAEIRRLIDGADVFLTDVPPGEIERLGLDAITCREQHPALVHLWLPPFGTEGRGSRLHADALLLAGMGGYADNYPAGQDRPVAPVVPTFLYLHGALAAAAAVAGLVGRERCGLGTAGRVSGLDAMGASLGTLMLKGVDAEGLPALPRSLRGAPYFRLYQGSDGAWFFLAALTPDIFIRSLDAIERLDLLVRDDVAGEFANLMLPAVLPMVNAELERTFASKPSAEWLGILRAADVPAAPVWSRDQWVAAQIVPAAARTEFAHDALGTVTVPAPPLSLPVTPMLTGGSSPTGAAGDWAARPPQPDAAPDSSYTELPLESITVVDICSFLAGPFVSSLLADFGADVVKVEPAGGDPYNVFVVSHAVVNQAKQVVGIDLRDPQARGAFLELVAGADLLVDNFMPESLRRLDLTAEKLAAVNPGLVRCSVSAFGIDNDWSNTPGFDPVLQSMTGLAVAQGSAAFPVPSTAPVIDASTGALGALGALAALFVRTRTGTAQHVSTSLAAGAVFAQSGELTTYADAPAPAAGGIDYQGPSLAKRFYQTSDGWIGVSADTNQARAAFFAAVGVDEPPELATAAAVTAVESALAARPGQHWLDLFALANVPAARALGRLQGINDPYLAANGFSHLLELPGLGAFRIVRSYSRWNGLRREPGRCPDRGRATVEVLTAAGVGLDVIASLLARKVISAPPAAPGSSGNGDAQARG